METTSRRADLAIWIWAFGYFAAYVPYSALTKALSSGELGPPKLTGLLDHEPPQGRELLGALLVLGAIALLSLPPVLKARTKPAALAGMGPPAT